MIVKICGITTLEDAGFALQVGADWIGLNLVSGPRRIGLPAALTILSGLGDPSRAVVLVTLRDGALEFSIAATLRDHGIRRLQLYGQVTPQALDSLQRAGFETILVQPVVDEHSLNGLDTFLSVCGDARPDYVLFDAATQEQPGGTGRLANWEAITQARTENRFALRPPFILAGGLNAGNVAEAIRRVTPVGVDVSSGVESTPGRKDPRKVEEFIQTVRGQSAE